MWQRCRFKMQKDFDWFQDIKYIQKNAFGCGAEYDLKFKNSIQSLKEG
ncbi:unnamed protein product [Paramecium pentaurelia]|uniref:Uncharacterized protein n=1 Tax=Paramecium pentaurelia TaxID=43138 RepID=A0A8S1YE66_9CILI|nr:unnamed protein product [Paramecium pentaurelia]